MILKNNPTALYLNLFLLISGAVCYSFSGNQITDLEYTTSAFTTEVAAWTYSFSIGNGPTSICGTTYLFGGFNRIRPNEFITRTYNNLPPHDMISFTLVVWRIDTLDSTDGFDVVIDGTTFSFRDMTAARATANICGGGGRDGAGLNVMGKFYHSASSLTLRIVNKCNQEPNDEIKYRDPTETNVTIQQGPVTALTVSPGVVTQTCNLTQYSNGTCQSCDASCHSCSGPTNRDCYRCNYNYYNFNNSCVPCSTGCRTCDNETSTSCSWCVNGYYLFADRTCRPNCNGNIVTGPPTTCTCAIDMWAYPNGTCLSSCSNSGYIGTNLTTVSYCDFACKSNEYFYSNGTCSTDCDSPFVRASGVDGKYCLFPCANGVYYYKNGSCINQCQFPFVIEDVGIGFFCNFACPSNQFIQLDGVCQDCLFPFKNYTRAQEKYCFFPCPDQNWFVYDNGTCSRTCPFPYVKVNITIGAFCRFPCPTDTYRYLNGTCLLDCDWPMTVRDVNVGKFCDFPCNMFTFFYPDLSCRSFCEAPFSIRDVSVGYYCDFPCPDFSYYFYQNASCLRSCPSPLKIIDTSNGIYCNFPCEDSSYYYYKENSTCLKTCPGSFVSQNITVGAYCNFPCPANNYLYLNGTCRTTCPKNFVKVDVSIGIYCNFPCRNFEYSYLNGTCTMDACEYPFVSRIDRYEYYCDFICGEDYLYQNGSCSSLCPEPYIERNEYGYKFCDFPCANRSLFYYENTSCLNNCSYPFSKRNAGVGYFCDFYCNNTQFYHGFNGTCWNSCKYPYIQKKILGYFYCSDPVEKAAFNYMKIGSISLTAASAIYLLAEPSIFWGMMTTYQDVSYMLFYNINFTYDARTFFRAFQVGNFFFLPTIHEIFGSGSPKKDGSSYSNMQQNGYPDILIDSCGSILTLIFFSAIVAITLIPLNFAFKPRIDIYKTLVPQGCKPVLLQLWIGLSSHFMYASILQFTNFDFSTGKGVFSNLLAIASIGGLLYSFVFMLKKSNKIRDDLPEMREKNSKAWPVIFDGIDLKRKEALRFNIVENLKRCIKVLPIIILYNNPKLQTTFGMSFVLGVQYLLKNKPLKSWLQFNAILIKELALFFVQMLIFMKASFKLKITDEQLGWALIYGSLFAVGTIQFYSIFRMIKIFIDYLGAGKAKSNASLGNLFTIEAKPTNNPFKSQTSKIEYTKEFTLESPALSLRETNRRKDLGLNVLKNPNGKTFNNIQEEDEVIDVSLVEKEKDLDGTKASSFHQESPDRSMSILIKSKTNKIEL